MWFRKINNEIVNKSALEKKSNLRIRNKITSVLLLKNFKNWKCTASNKECYFAKIKAVYPTQINWKKLNKTKSNPIFFFHFLVMFRTTLNIKLIIVKFNFIVASIFYNIVPSVVHTFRNWCLSIASFKIPSLLAVRISVMLTCVPFKSFLFKNVSFSRIIANKCNDYCTWFITRSLLLINTVSSV